MKLKSFCLVGTGNLSKEVATCIFSIRRLYNLPIYIAGDDELINYLKPLGFTNVFITKWANKENLDKIDVSSVKTPVDTYHSKEIIYLKFDVLDWAIREAGNSLLIDSDIIIKDYIDRDIGLHQEVMLSPTYWMENRSKLSEDWGAFNAGYLYARNPDVASTWRHIYLHESEFYEQEGMYKLFNHYDCFVFNRQHNFGFWRFTYVNKKVQGDRTVSIAGLDKINLDFVKSFHFRLGYYDYKKGYLLGRAQAFKNAVLPYIPHTIVEYHNSL
jgi:hypothetical protein